MRYRQGSHATSFFIKADTELQQMVEDYCNLDLNESIAYNRTGLSQAERRLMASVEETSTLLKDGHYEIPYHSKIDSIQFQTIVFRLNSVYLSWRKGWRRILGCLMTTKLSMKILSQRGTHGKFSRTKGNQVTKARHGSYHTMGFIIHPNLKIYV